MSTIEKIEKFFEEMNLNTSNRVITNSQSQAVGMMLGVKDSVDSDQTPTTIATLSPVPGKRTLIIFKWEHPDHEKFVRQAVRTALDMDIPFEYAP